MVMEDFHSAAVGSPIGAWASREIARGRWSDR